MSETIITALVYSLFTSAWQAALVWLVFQLFQSRFSLSAANTYWMVFALLLMLFVAWVGNFMYRIENPYPPSLQLLPASFETGNFSIPNPILSIFAFIYFLGCLYQVIRFAQSLYQLRLLAKNQLPLPAAALSIIHNMQNTHPALRKISVSATLQAGSPLTFGWLQPIMLLPVAALNSLSMEEVQSIVLHELAHIRRNDFLHECIISTLEVVMCCNPFVHLLIKQLREEREKACDDEVIQSGIPVYSYAKALLAFSQSNPTHPSTPAMAFSGNQPRLLNRIKRLAACEQEKKSIPLISTSFSVFVVLIGLVWVCSTAMSGNSNNAYASVPVAASTTTPIFPNQQPMITPVELQTSATSIPSTQQRKSYLAVHSSKRLHKLTTNTPLEKLQETENSKTTLPVIAVAQQSGNRLANFEQLLMNWKALPDSVFKEFSAIAISQLSPDDRIIWMQALQKLYEVNTENESNHVTINRQAAFIILLHTSIAEPLSGIALQYVSNIGEQIKAYYFRNHIIINGSNDKDSTRNFSRLANIQ